MATIGTGKIQSALIEPGSYWSTPNVTFSFPTSSAANWSGYDPGEEPFNADFAGLSAAQQSNAMLALGLWDALIPLSFSQVSEAQGQVGAVRVAFSDLDDYNDDGEAAAAYAYLPAPGSTAAKRGDVWIDDEYKDASFAPGSPMFATLLHEFGHALGLKHPFEGASTLPAEWDNERYTVMSYEGISYAASFVMDGNTLKASGTLVSAATPMLFDVVAIQSIYGKSLNVSLGDTTWSFAPGFQYVATIVDNGGTDTLDLANHTRGSIIDLTPGSYSSIDYFSTQQQIDYWTAQFPQASLRSFIIDWLDDSDTYTWANNVATSLDTVIEVVRAGSGDDTIGGNTASNSIFGGAGDDRIEGGDGQDYLRGEDGNDSISGGAEFDDLHGNAGNDTVFGGLGDDWVVGGKDQDYLRGDAGGDVVLGNLGDDTCEGGDGNDVVRGGQQNDILFGGAGDDYMSGDRDNDTITGGAGADLFHSFAEAGIDRVLDFSRAEGDRVMLDPGSTYTVAQVGADTVVTVGGQAQVILVGVQLSSLSGDWIFVM